ncbi:hypothetical protein [Haloplanus halobius]|uniref:hypothetical protein n=1 Tax=Haloplanus halobius TaxID=2934938 RepID=UPI00200FCDDB|nr:hypothetical protein [Haloplanus sp. XH21]
MPTTVGHSGQRIAFERYRPREECCCCLRPLTRPTASSARYPAHAATRPPVAPFVGDRGRLSGHVRAR